MSTDDEERLTPLGVAVNGQDQPEISPASHHHLADHHVIARTGSARRHRQGPQAARSAGGAKRRALHGDEHRSSIERVMVGASVAVVLVVTPRTPKRTTIAPGAHATTSRTIGRGTSALTDSDLRREQNQIVRIKWVTISVTFTRTVNAGADANDALTDSDTVTGSDGVSDPSGHARGHWKRAHRGRSRHRSSYDTDRGSSSGGKGRRPSQWPAPHVRPVEHPPVQRVGGRFPDGRPPAGRS